jgi:hypothetical protein
LSIYKEDINIDQLSYSPADNTNTYRISKLCHIEISQAFSYFFFSGGVSACSEFYVEKAQQLD